MTSEIVLAGVLGALGAVLSSFLHVMVTRTLRGLEWVRSRSRCERCKHVLAPLDLVPLFSFVWLGGRCRYCHRPIAWSHWLFEVGCVAWSVAVALLIPAPTVFAWWLIGLVSAAIVLSDVEAMLIPDRAVMAIGFGTSVVWGLKLSGVASAQLWPHGSLWPALAAALLLTLMFWFLWAMTRGRGMGLGDVKLVFPLALLVGWPGVVVMTLVAFISGALVGVGLLATQHANRKHTLPFAPFLFVGVVVTLWWGPEVLSWLKW